METTEAAPGDERPAGRLTLAEQLTRALGGSVRAVEAAGSDSKLYAEITVQTDQRDLVDVIDIDEFQTGFVGPNESGFFGGPVNKRSAWRNSCLSTTGRNAPRLFGRCQAT